MQNWETGGARIPWMAYRMLRILRGYALPGKAWEDWSVHGDRLVAPNGRCYEANSLEQIEIIFGMPPEAFNPDTAKRGQRIVYALGEGGLHPLVRVRPCVMRRGHLLRGLSGLREGGMDNLAHVSVAMAARDWKVTPRRIRFLLGSGRLEGREGVNGYWVVSFFYHFTFGSRGTGLERFRVKERGSV